MAIKNISIRDNKVYLTADGSDPSVDFERQWEADNFSKTLREKGKRALYAHIGKELWREVLELEPGSKICDHFIKARIAFPKGMNFQTFDSETAGVIMADMVEALEKDPKAVLNKYVDRAMELRNDREYILDCAKREGYNFLNYAGEEVQNDRSFAMEVVKAGGRSAWFQYPAQYSEDKEFALEALKLNGCFYRDLGQSLKADREISMEAFAETPDKAFHEHLPDLIPKEVYKQKDGLDKEFIYKLLDACPAMHMHRVPELLDDRDIAMKWVQVGKFFPHSVMDLPMKHLNDRELQDALIQRFENTDKYDYLMQNFAVKGLLLVDKSLNKKILSASSKSNHYPSFSDKKNKVERSL